MARGATDEQIWRRYVRIQRGKFAFLVLGLTVSLVALALTDRVRFFLYVGCGAAAGAFGLIRRRLARSRASSSTADDIEPLNASLVAVPFLPEKVRKAFPDDSLWLIRRVFTASMDGDVDLTPDGVTWVPNSRNASRGAQSILLSIDDIDHASVVSSRFHSGLVIRTSDGGTVLFAAARHFYGELTASIEDAGWEVAAPVDQRDEHPGHQDYHIPFGDSAGSSGTP